MCFLASDERMIKNNELEMMMCREVTVVCLKSSISIYTWREALNPQPG
jgi:hypothetical protein